jgi:hypothetical protein
MGASASRECSSWEGFVGISFYTFEALSYTIDVYRDKIKAEAASLDVDREHVGCFIDRICAEIGDGSVHDLERRPYPIVVRPRQQAQQPYVDLRRRFSDL